MTKLPKELTTITPLSKIAAIIAFITLPVIGFFLGIRYQEMYNLTSYQNQTVPIVINPAPVTNKTANWKTYTNAEAKISIETPSEWKITEETPNVEYKGILLQGKEGQVGIRWGAGFGGACPQGYESLKLYSQTVDACRNIANDGTERWSLSIGKVNNIDYSGNATANEPYASTREVILKILSTLQFLDKNSYSQECGGCGPKGLHNLEGKVCTPGLECTNSSQGITSSVSFCVKHGESIEKCMD